MLRGLSLCVCTMMLLTLVRFTESQSGNNFHYSVYEELPAGSLVGDVLRDSSLEAIHSAEELSQIWFEFRPSKDTKHFILNETTGQLATAHVLDREVLCPYKLDCQLQFDVVLKPREFFQVFKVIVGILDLNDHQPVFTRQQITIDIPESSLPGVLFLLPSADDEDSGVLGIQRYWLSPNSDNFELKITDLFDGSKDVQLRLKSRLDRDSRRHHMLALFASDGGLPPRSSSVTVEVAVLESVDSNGLKFDNASYNIAISENLPRGASVLRVRATDLHDRSVTYSFAEQTQSVHGLVFTVGSTSGDIMVSGDLDFEQTPLYHLTVTAVSVDAKDTVILPAYARINIQILDVNDNAPIITINVLSCPDCSTQQNVAQISENMPSGTFIAHVSVSDRDPGSNGQIHCGLSPPIARQLFHLEPLQFESEFKVVSLVAFDREEQSEYEMMLVCGDRGRQPLTSVASLKVNVVDLNDNDPQLSQTQYTVKLAENNAIGAAVESMISVTDRDAGLNSALKYSLRPHDDDTPASFLTVNELTGALYAGVSFDAETRQEYVYLLTVTDQGIPLRSTSATLTLTIADANDEQPVFEKFGYYFATPENGRIGTIIGSVSAVDNDISTQFNQVVYELAATNLAFGINPQSGDIRTLKRLDREETVSHVFSVTAFNHGVPRVDSNVTVTVYVDDINDNRPVIITKNHVVKVAVNAAKESFVTRIDAWDPDSGANGVVTYSITNGNDGQTFDIDSMTGIISLANNENMKSLYTLIVVVRDNGEPALMSVYDLTIQLVDSLEAPSALAAESLLHGVNLIVLIGIIVGVVVILILIVLVVLFVRWKKKQRTRQKDQDVHQLNNEANASICDGMTLAEIYNDLSRSMDLAHQLCRSIEMNSSGIDVDPDSDDQTAAPRSTDWPQTLLRENGRMPQGANGVTGTMSRTTRRRQQLSNRRQCRCMSQPYLHRFSMAPPYRYRSARDFSQPNIGVSGSWLYRGSVDSLCSSSYNTDSGRGPSEDESKRNRQQMKPVRRNLSHPNKPNGQSDTANTSNQSQTRQYLGQSGPNQSGSSSGHNTSQSDASSCPASSVSDEREALLPNGRVDAVQVSDINRNCGSPSRKKDTLL